MATIEDRAADGEKVLADDRDYLIHSWSVQSALKPLAVAGAEGRYFWDYDGKRYLDFASQLVNVSIGHQHPRVVQRSRTRPTSSARSARRWRTTSGRSSPASSPR